MKNILYINHKKAQCGVYEFGKSTGSAISQSKKYNFIYSECDSFDRLKKLYREHRPSCIFFNYHPLTQNWVTPRLKYFFGVPLVGTIHEVTQKAADLADNTFFDYYVAADPTLLLRNPIVYKVGRLINVENFEAGAKENNNSKTIIGSFGFGTNGKGFEKIIEIVEKEFDTATIRLNIPFADFGDKDGKWAEEISQNCQNLVRKKGIKLEITHHYWQTAELLEFLDRNTINAFFYDDAENRGISSVLDFALAVDRPIAVTRSSLFRHVLDTSPSICIEDLSLKQIISNGIKPLEKFKKEWTADNLVWDYERITDSVLAKPLLKRSSYMLSRARRKVKKILGRTDSNYSFSWLRPDETFQNEESIYLPDYKFESVEDNGLNRILDNFCRELYAPVIRQMSEIMPKTMAKKIPEANVQQAFTLNTVYNFARHLRNPKILCVGSYESTDSMFLKRIGFDIKEIDPCLNYSLEEFYSKPTTDKNAYDIIFSTSVIEHVEKDEMFVKQISNLLKDGGIAIITCDFKEGFQAGDPKPSVDYLFYTQNDLKNRFLPLIEDCELVDEPDWDCPNPDFHFVEGENEFNYTFATLVFKKNIK